MARIEFQVLTYHVEVMLRLISYRRSILICVNELFLKFLDSEVLSGLDYVDEVGIKIYCETI